VDHAFVLRSLILKDFRIRYRSMSLGMAWSILNPLIMMSVLTFVFTRLNPPNIKGLTDYPLFFLCGLIPYNFLTVTWANGTNCIVDNSVLIRRTKMPRETVPVASVLSSGLHLLIQIGLLLSMTLIKGHGISMQWLWLPVVWGIAIVFVIGLVLLCSALDVFIRDMRYLVESAITLLFWFMPIFYTAEVIAAHHKPWWELNPFTILILSQRSILLDARSPDPRLLIKMSIVSAITLIAGWIVFRTPQRKFYDHL
jgi:ABC-type polysaccharide/polyol phosphate export permease